MDIREILGKCDHTLLLQASTWEEIRDLLDDAIHYGTASVCIPPCYVKQAAEYAAGRMPICTVMRSAGPIPACWNRWRLLRSIF